MSRMNTCSTCAHYGCCDGLPSCGGLFWRNAYGECDQCGARLRLEDAEYEDDDGHVFCCEECMSNFAADNAEDEEDKEKKL